MTVIDTASPHRKESCCPTVFIRKVQNQAKGAHGVRNQGRGYLWGGGSRVVGGACKGGLGLTMFPFWSRTSSPQCVHFVIHGAGPDVLSSIQYSINYVLFSMNGICQ